MATRGFALAQCLNLEHEWQQPPTRGRSGYHDQDDAAIGFTLFFHFSCLPNSDWIKPWSLAASAHHANKPNG
jgi:hypothetical protein